MSDPTDGSRAPCRRLARPLPTACAPPFVGERTLLSVHASSLFWDADIQLLDYDVHSSPQSVEIAISFGDYST